MNKTNSDAPSTSTFIFGESKFCSWLRKQLNYCRENSLLLNLIMGIIAIAQAVLIILVIIIVADNHNKHTSFLEEYNNKASLFYTEESKIDSLNNQSVSYAAFFDEASEKMVGLEAQIMQANDYFTILLSLITLCATLAVVIPYIVGRAVSRNLIIEEVNDKIKEKESDLKSLINEHTQIIAETKAQIKNLEDKKEKAYDEIIKQGGMTISKLKMAEAHQARMTSYLLLSPYLNKSESDKIVDKMWSIGWAAKSLVRYFDEYQVKVLDQGSYYAIEKFINYASSYIVDSGRSLRDFKYNPKEDHNDIKGKVLRAFIDLFDAVMIAESSEYTKGFVTEELNKTLTLLYRQAESMNGEGGIVFSLLAKTKMRSKFDDETLFRDWIDQSLERIKH